MNEDSAELFPHQQKVLGAIRRGPERKTMVYRPPGTRCFSLEMGEDEVRFRVMNPSTLKRKKKSMSQPKVLREGFWHSVLEPYLPMPVPRGNPWKGQKLFLEKLAEVESTAKEVSYRGFSHCRICNCSNGTTEFTALGWKWPSGYAHYVKAHNVRPSLAFQETIVMHDVI